MRRILLAAALVGALVAPTASAFDNTEPLAAKQWYLTADNAWSNWPTMPQLFPVRVAVIDSGVDGGHPEFKGRIAASKTFIGGSALQDTDGHGTFVAGEIAANPTNQTGIAGLAFNAQLLVAKVVAPGGDVSLPGEVAAIHWAVDNGARVINLSLGGVRDPFDPKLDSYSPLEQAAIDYAYAKGAVVVSAVGNGPQSPATPWNFADYPAALPHVIGVSALRRDGSVPAYSNRDSVYNDIAAPGDNIFSTIPRALVDQATPCADGPYSDCGPTEFRDAIGTSFAAPLVSAAAALLLGQQPTLAPDQVAWLLERSATDASAATGCPQCPAGRDALSGWGALDVQAAFQLLSTGAVPPRDRYEPNDDAGPWSHALPPLPRTITASLDYWDDDVDVYRIHLAAGARLFARLVTKTPGAVRMSLWAPGTQHVEGLKARISDRLAQSRRVGPQVRLASKAPEAGVYYLELKLTSGHRLPTQYALSLARKAP